MRCPHLEFFISYITPNLSALCPHCTHALIIWPYIIIELFYCQTSLLPINCCCTSLLPIFPCYASCLVFSYLFSRVCWCCVGCASPPFLLIGSIFGDSAEVPPPSHLEMALFVGANYTFLFLLLLCITEI